MASQQVREHLASFADMTRSEGGVSPAGELLAAARAFSQEAMEAVRSGTSADLKEDGDRLAAVAEDAARLRLLDFVSAEALAEARFWHGYLLISTDADAAYAELGGVVTWGKPLLANLEFGSEQDFVSATNIVFISSMAYLLAYRYLKPEARHLADKGIAVDIERTFRRVFPDPVLGDTFAAMVGKFEARS